MAQPADGEEEGRAPVKFHFERIGPIDVADLELGDLTIIAGRNNTGKTYLVYTMYGFLQTWASPWQRPLAPNRESEFVEFLDSDIGTRKELPREYIELLRRRRVSSAASRFSQSGIPHVFSAPSASFPDARLSVHVDPELPRAGTDCYSITRRDEYRVAVRYGVRTVELELISRTPSGGGRLSARRLANDVAHPDFPRPFVLSAERFGISLFYKELDFTKSRLVEMLQEMDDTKRTPLLVVNRIASRYAMPVRHNVDFTRSIEHTLHQESEFADDELHKEIENLMSGRYASTDGVIRFKSKARRSRAFDIPLHTASSSARGLSDLYFYLRHVASKNDILFIDEPETHLDTANQVMLARVMSRLVNAGLKVLVSTHSDYLIKEIGNLVMLHHLRGKGVAAGKRRYGPHDGIGGEHIRAYVAENNTLTPCVVDQYGIDMPMFDKTIDDINRTSAELAAAVADTEQ